MSRFLGVVAVIVGLSYLGLWIHAFQGWGSNPELYGIEYCFPFVAALLVALTVNRHSNLLTVGAYALLGYLAVFPTGTLKILGMLSSIIL